MERIRQALEQAERDRSKLAADDGAEEKISTVVPEKNEEPSAAATVQTVGRDIQSQRTRVIDVAPEVLEKNRLVTAIPGHELTDSYRLLRTRVLQAMDSNGWRSLAITSPATGAGKTLTSINLAISLAREINRTVLLVDLDLRQPSIHEYFDFDPPAGLGDYLFADAPLRNMLFSPSIDRLVLLPGRESVHNSSEMLRSPKMIGLVDELKGRYKDRLIIFDLPPVLEVDDALAFKPYTDALLLVIENGATKREDLEKSLELLKGTPIIGTVLNKAAGVKAGTYSYAKRS